MLSGRGDFYAAHGRKFRRVRRLFSATVKRAVPPRRALPNREIRAFYGIRSPVCRGPRSACTLLSPYVARKIYSRNVLRGPFENEFLSPSGARTSDARIKLLGA